MEKDPMASLLWPWGLSLLFIEGQKVLKHFEGYAISYDGGENKETNQPTKKSLANILSEE